MESTMDLIRHHEKQLVECSYCGEKFNAEREFCPYCFTDTLDTWLLENFGEDGLHDGT
jgi:uncharacterized OB-fold protein